MHILEKNNLQYCGQTDKLDLLHSILKHFNIELSNPMTILQQEEAKNFFKQNDDVGMYKFFQQGTMLDVINRTNKKTMAEIALMSDSNEVKDLTLLNDFFL